MTAQGAAERPYSSLSEQTEDVPFVFDAHVIDQVGIEHNFVNELDRPGSCVGFGIVNRDFDFHSAVVHAAESLSHFGSICYRTSATVQPHSIVKADRLHDQRVSVPRAGRIPLEAWHINLRERTSVR